MRRSAVAVAGAGVAVAAAGAVAVAHRRRGGELVEIAWEDGGAVTLHDRSPDRERMLEVARGALDAVRA